MYAEVLKGRKKPKKTDTAHYVDKNGKKSNETLHDEISKGVSGKVGLKHARAAATEGLDKETLDLLFPEQD